MALFHQIKQGDTAPVLQPTLGSLAVDGVTVIPQNLTGTTVVFSMKPVGSITPAVNKAACTIVDAVNGVVKYAWIAADTANAGAFEGEFQVTFADASVMTFPNDGNFPITITTQIA